jgi:hypothetical protein
MNSGCGRDMRSVGGETRVAALVGVLLSLSCGKGVDLPDGKVWTSAHFRYAARADDAGACAGVTEQLEAHFNLLNAYLGLTWPGGVIDYYKFRDLGDLHQNSDCAALSNGCASSNDVRSPLALDAHELIHIYTRHLGRPPALFEEGIANALSPAGRFFTAPSKSWQELLALPMLEGGVPPDLDYYAGGWFVSYLLRQYGSPPFIAFYGAVAAQASAAEVSSQFQQSFGVALDDVWAAALVATPSPAGVPIWECVGEAMVVGGAAADLSERCDGRGAFATLDLPNQTALTWVDNTTLGFDVTSCPPAPEIFAEPLLSEMQHPGAIALPAGKYYVAPNTTPGTLGLREVAGQLATDCNALTPFVLPADSGTLTFALPSGPNPWFVEPQTAQASTFSFTRMEDSIFSGKQIVATVEVCDACTGPCRAFDGLTAVQLSNGMILRITGLTARAGATIVRFSY